MNRLRIIPEGRQVALCAEVSSLEMGKKADEIGESVELLASKSSALDWL